PSLGRKLKRQTSKKQACVDGKADIGEGRPPTASPPGDGRQAEEPDPHEQNRQTPERDGRRFAQTCSANRELCPVRARRIASVRLRPIAARGRWQASRAPSGQALS